MPSKFNKVEAKATIKEIERRLGILEYQRSLIQYNRYRYSGREGGITTFLYKLAGTNVPESANKYSYYYSLEETFITNYINTKMIGLLASTDRYALENNHRTNARIILDKFKRPINEQIEALTKKKSEIQSRIYAAKGRKNKDKLGDTLAHKIMEGNEEPLAGLYFALKSGREVDISFTMSTGNGYRYDNGIKEPLTFMDIGLAKIEGYMFNSHYKKLRHGNRDVYAPNAKTKLGVIRAAAKPGATQEVIDAAHELKSKMGDTLFCKYIDSGHMSSFKAKEIFLFNRPKKVNKQTHRSVFRGKDRLNKQRAYKRNLTNATT